MLVTMSDKELRRINVIQSVVEKRMRRRDAVQQLALTERQTQRLMNRFRESGAAGLTNLRRGRPGNHRLPESLKLRVLSLLHDHYSDFIRCSTNWNVSTKGKSLITNVLGLF